MKIVSPNFMTSTNWLSIANNIDLFTSLQLNSNTTALTKGTRLYKHNCTNHNTINKCMT